MKSVVPSILQSFKYCLLPFPVVYKIFCLPRRLQFELKTLLAFSAKTTAYKICPADFFLVKF